MGTRSITTVYENVGGTTEHLVCMYRHFDGYPSGHGVELGQFLEPVTVVNGLSGGQPARIANGAGCLAAQMVEHFKKESGVGGIYLYPMDENGKAEAGQDYEYEVHCTRNEPGITVRCVDRPTNDVLFEGTPAEFVAWAVTQ
jgi:phage tail sheath gpL-like